MARMSEQQYIEALEDFKRLEMTKRKYRGYGLSPTLASAAAGAEISGNEKMLQAVFRQHNEELRTGNTSEAKKKEDAFLQGFQNGGRW